MKKLLSRFLCLVMFLSLFSSEKAAKASQQAEPNGEAEQVCELTEYRTKNSETFLLSDGTRDCVVYTENKYFEDPTGKLVPIDNSIVETPYTEGEREYRYKNAANDTVFYFAETEPAVLVRFQDKSLMYSLIGTKETKAIRGGSECFKQVGEYSLCGENYIAYPNVMEETELVYAVYNGSVKEYIVLNSKSAPTEFSFYFESGEYSIRETENGRPGFYNKAGDLAFELGSLYAVDAAGKYTDQLTYSVKESETGTAVVTITLSKDYAKSAERVYPILIDPSIMVSGADVTYDTFVSSKYPNTNYFEDNHVRTGRDDDLYIRRTYMRFVLPSNISANDVVTSYIRIKKYNNTNAVPNVKAYRVLASWTSSTLTWNNKPNFTTTNASPTATLVSGDWYKANITTIVKGWLNGTYSDYGVMLKDATETGTTQWTTFYASEAASPNKPELHIVIGNPISVNRVYSTFAMTSEAQSQMWYRMGSYGYALQVFSATASENNSYDQIVGEFADDQQTFNALIAEQNNINYCGNATTMLNYYEGKMYDDFSTLYNTYGSEWTISSTTLSGTIPAGYRKIAMTVGYGKGVLFYMRHSDGTWSYKNGNSYPSNVVPGSSSQITDSNISSVISASEYANGVRYYLIKKSAVIDYPHLDGHTSNLVKTVTGFGECAGSAPITSTVITSINNMITGELDYTNDKDYFAFTPSSSGTYTITCQSETWVDMQMIIYDGYENIIGEDYTYGQATIVINLDANAIIFIKVYEANGYEMGYGLSITMN